MSSPVRPLARGGAVVGVVAAAAPPAARVRPAAVTRGPRDDERHFETIIIRGAVAQQCLAGSRSNRADQERLPALRNTQLGLDSFSQLPECRRTRQKEVTWLP